MKYHLDNDWREPPVTRREKVAELVSGLSVVAMVGLVYLLVRGMNWASEVLP